MIFLRWLMTAGFCLAGFIAYSFLVEFVLNLIGGKGNGK